jgi:hypothetical protein
VRKEVGRKWYYSGDLCFMCTLRFSIKSMETRSWDRSKITQRTLLLFKYKHSINVGKRHSSHSFSANSLMRDLSIDTSFNPPLLSLVDTFKCPRRSLQPNVFLTPWTFLTFYFHWDIFACLDLDPNSQSRSFDTIRIRNTDCRKTCFLRPEDYRAIGETPSVPMKKLSLKNIEFLSSFFSVDIFTCRFEV